MRSASPRIEEDSRRTKTPFDAAASQWPPGVHPDTFDKGLSDEQARARIDLKPALTKRGPSKVPHAGCAAV